METFLVKALQLILSFSILVIVHEFGHFIFARIFKVRVEKFYLFFDPWFSLFKFKPKNSDTEYGIGWLPLGGYCKISGMIDESMDKEQMAQPPKPYEFRSKPAGQRLLIMVGGVLFNFLLALFIYSMTLYAWGDSYLPLKNMKMGMYYSDVAKEIGFQDGDILYKADEEVLERYHSDAIRKVFNAVNATLIRDGQEIIIPIPDDIMQRMIRSGNGFASPERYPMIVENLREELPIAKAAGILPGDTIVAINGTSTPTLEESFNELAKYRDADISIDVKRGNEIRSFALHTDTAAQIGIFIKLGADKIYQTEHIEYSFFASFPAGITKGINTLKGYVNDMKYVFTKEGASTLGGFGAIGNLFPAEWDWQSFWTMTAFLSIILGFMNILPIPALDGGHVMFTLYEIITRRKPSDKFLEYAQIVGMTILFALLIYANGNDLYRFFIK